MGGRTDDPRRERTRNAAARHRAGAGAGQRQRGVPRDGDLADPVLSVAPTAGTLWGRRRPPAPAARPTRGAQWRRRRKWSAWCSGSRSVPPPGGADGSPRTSRRTWQVRVAPSTVQRLLRRVGLATPRARLTVLEQQAARRHGRAADGTDAGEALARPPRSHAARRGDRAGRAGVPGHLLHRQPQRRGQSLADHGVRCGDLVSGWPACCRPTTRRPPPRFLREVVVPRYQRAGWPVRRVLTDGGPEFKGALDEACRAARRSAHPHETAPCVDQRLRRTAAGHDSPRALARGVPATLLHHAARPCNAPSTASCATTTPSGRTKATASAVAPRPRSSGAWRQRSDLIHHSGTAKVSTPFRVWTH